ncbi:acyl-CoA dehydrogenase family protein [Streptomyces sp. NPDC057302]|uniref:acyl-CoA dehydrogenase family protein n=1 Tax=Streptomyces sp. NPDC057302 TaxID=3346094 RepID=UPI00363DDA40
MTTVANKAGRAGRAGRADTSEAGAQERIARLEHRLGDLDDPGNPLGVEQLLAADAAGRPLAAAERALDEFGLNAEFVPARLGGRLERLDVLARVLRAVFRRDASLGLGYGVTSYLAGVIVWADGTAAQQRAVADLLLGGGRIACAYPEPPTGNDFLRNRFSALAQGAGYRLNGRKEALNNAARAQSLLIFADGPDAGQGSSAFLIEGPDADSASAALLGRYETTGIRGCLVHGLQFCAHPVTTQQLVGRAGAAGELARRAFPLTRAIGPSMALGCADTALRTTVAFARSRRLRSRASLQSPRTRTALADAFADLLLCDALGLVATRAVHELPRQSNTFSAAVKYLLPTVLTEAVYDLSIVLGSESYARSGSYGIFQKAVRDLPMIGLGSAGGAASRGVLIDHLLQVPGLRAPGGGQAPAALFQPFGDDLAPVRPDELVLAPDGDCLLGSLESSMAHAAAAHGEFAAHLGESAARLGAELSALRAACTALGSRPGERAVSPRAYALADRYALIAAGAACLGTWRHQAGSGGFLGEPLWAVMALARILRRLDSTAAAAPAAAADRFVHELLSRFEDARSYDLYATSIGR